MSTSTRLSQRALSGRRRLLFVHSQAARACAGLALTTTGTVADEEIPYDDECRPGRSRSFAGRRRWPGTCVGALQDEFARRG